MKRTVLLGTLLVLALLISACGPAQVTRVPSTSLPVASETPAATKAPVGTASPAVAATNTGTAAGTPSASATGTPEASVPVTGQAVVKAASNVDYGPILITGDGLPLYISTVTSRMEAPVPAPTRRVPQAGRPSPRKEWQLPARVPYRVFWVRSPVKMAKPK